jgi:periplasmic copper chaperone A
MQLKARLIASVLAFGLASQAITASSAHEVTVKGVTVAHPWARATPGGATVGAAFMEIRTEAGVTDTLVSATSPVAGRVEVHTHTMEGDVMKMRRLEALQLKAGDSRVLKPMGDHVMLFDLKKPLKEGETVTLTLTFAKAGAIEVQGTVEPAGAMGPHGFDTQPSTDAKTPPGKSKSDQKSGHEHHHH